MRRDAFFLVAQLAGQERLARRSRCASSCTYCTAPEADNAQLLRTHVQGAVSFTQQEGVRLVRAKIGFEEAPRVK